VWVFAEQVVVRGLVIPVPEARETAKANPSFTRSIANARLFSWSVRLLRVTRSPVWKVWNLPGCFFRACASVRRASGFVQTGFWEIARDESPILHEWSANRK
jgi:hypothetical protein